MYSNIVQIKNKIYCELFFLWSFPVLLLNLLCYFINYRKVHNQTKSVVKVGKRQICLSLYPFFLGNKSCMCTYFCICLFIYLLSIYLSVCLSKHIYSVCVYSSWQEESWWNEFLSTNQFYVTYYIMFTCLLCGLILWHRHTLKVSPIV